MACKGTPAAEQIMTAGNQASQWLADYTKANLNMAQSAVNAFSPMFSAWSQWYGSMLPSQLTDLYKSFGTDLASAARTAACNVPTMGCPPKCGCTITWDASPGEQRKSTFKIQNTSKDRIVYSVVSQPFKSCGKTLKSAPQVSEQQVAVAPGESVAVTASLAVTEEFESGKSYEAEILVRGKYERCVKVVLTVACECDDVCKLDVGDIPYSTSFDSWYKHFLCSQPCFEPIQQTPPDRTDPATGAVLAQNPAVTGQNYATLNQAKEQAKDKPIT